MTQPIDRSLNCEPESKLEERRGFFLFKAISLRERKPLVLLAYLAVVVLFFYVFFSFYIQSNRFSYLVMFGDKQPPVISDLDGVNYYLHEDSFGYDGQFYAQIAVDPTLRNPELVASVDNLSYRGRRILMSLSAYLMGWGIPEAVLHTYTLQNLIAWALLAGLLLWWFPPTSWGNWFRWTGVLLCSGMWVSMIYALTDGPSLLLVALGVFLVERNRPWLGAAVLGIGGLAKETNILAGALFADPERLVSPRKWLRPIFQGMLILAPLVLWVLYIKVFVGLSSNAGSGNFSWPLFEWFLKLKTAAIDAFSQDFFTSRGLPNSSFLCLLGLLALSVQCAFFLLLPQWNKLWWRVGASFSLLMAALGQAVWEGAPVASFRVLLPMQLAFNVLVPRTRRWLPVLILGNLSLLTEVHFILDKMKHTQSIARIERALQESVPVNRPSKGNSISVVFSSGWHGKERSIAGEWVWASGTSEIVLHNNSRCPEEVNLVFMIYSLEERDFRVVGADGKVLWRTDSLKEKEGVSVNGVVLEPGSTVLRFETSTKPGFAPGDTRPLAFCVENFSVYQAAQAAVLH